MLGWRSRDLERAYLPFLHGKGIAQYTSDPVFTRLISERMRSTQSEQQPRPTLAALRTLIELTRAYPGGFVQTLLSGRGRAAVERFTEIYSRPSLTWDDARVPARAHEPADRAQGDPPPGRRRRAPSTRASTASSSPTTAAARSTARSRRSTRCRRSSRRSDGRIPCCSTRASAAAPTCSRRSRSAPRAVLIGRPYVYGLAIAGRAGVREVIENLAADFDLTMGLAGCRSVSDIGPDALTPAPGLPAPPSLSAP